MGLVGKERKAKAYGRSLWDDKQTCRYRDLQRHVKLTRMALTVGRLGLPGLRGRMLLRLRLK